MASVASGQNGAKRTSTVASNRFSVAGTDMQALAWEDDSDLLQTDSILSRSRAAVRRAEEQLFGLLYLMTKDRKKMFNNRSSNTFLLVFDFLQFMFFVFSGDFPWYHKINFVQKLFDLFQMTASQIPQIVFFPIFLLICGVMLAMMGLAVHVAKVSKRAHFQQVNLIIILRSMVALFITLGYIPFLKVSIVPMDCTFDETGAYMDAFPEIRCFEGIHILSFFVSIIVFITFVPFALIMSLVYFDSHPKSPNFLSRATNRVDFLYTLCRTIVVLISTFLTNMTGLRVAVVFLANIIMLVAYLVHPPYHRYQPTCLRIAFFATGAVSSFFAIITVAVDDTNNWAIVTVLGIFIIPVFFGSYVGAQKYLDQLSNKAATLTDPKDPMSFKFKTPFMVEFATRKYLRLDEYTEVTATNIEIVKNIYVKGMTQFPHSASLRVQYALFLIAYIPTSAATEVKLLVVEMSKLRKVPFDIRFLIFNLRWVWQQDMETRGLGRRGGLDLIDYIYFKRNFALAKHFHKEARRSLFNFWKLLLRQNTSLVQLEAQAEEFERMEQIALAAYEKLLIKYFNSKDLLRSYGSFWLDIYHDTAMSNECFALADEIEDYENRKFQRRVKKAGNLDSEGESADDGGNSEPSADESQGTQTDSEDDDKRSRVRSDHMSSSSGRERTRLKKMKARLDKMRVQTDNVESPAVRRFTFLLFTLQVFLFVIPITGIAIFNQMYTSIRLNSKEMSIMHDQIFQVQNMLYMTHSYEVVSISNTVPNTKYYNCTANPSCQQELEKLRTSSFQMALDFHDRQSQLFYKITEDQNMVVDFWVEPSMKFDIFVGPPIRRESRIFNLIDVGDMFVDRATSVFQNEDMLNTWEEDVSYLFCIENGPHIVTDAYMKGSQIHLDYEEALVNDFTLMFSAMASAAALFFIIVGLLWGPIYRVVVSEVSSLSHLKALRKEDAQEMCAYYRFTEKGDDEESSAFRGEQARKVNERAKFRRTVFLVLSSLAMCGVIAVVYTGIFAARQPVVLTNKAAERAALSYMSKYLVREILATEGNITLASQDYALDILTRIRNVHEELVNAASGDGDQETWLFVECPGVPPPGVYSYVADFLAHERDIIYNAPSIPFEKRIQRAVEEYSLTIVEDPLINCLISSRDNYQKRAFDGEYTTFASTNVYFWIVWPCFFVATMFALPIEFRQQVISSSSRSRRMLRMLPHEMIQRNPEIYEYMIEKGLIEGTLTEEEKYLGAYRKQKKHGSQSGGSSQGGSTDRSSGSDDSDSSSSSSSSDSSQGSNKVSSVKKKGKKSAKKEKNLNRNRNDTKSRTVSPQSADGSSIETGEKCETDTAGSDSGHYNRNKKTKDRSDKRKKKGKVYRPGDVEVRKGVLEKIIDRLKTKPKKEQKFFEEKLCEKCQKRERCVMLLPCGHFLYCAQCSRSFSKCPQCKHSIKQKEIINID
eukprot:TRINITY_DN215_c0_g3_i1.p1 TRINITY_DN215_c0_g3~~TRINITY_DN215_c0_g3_i1.p1  ORF type:complete len:1441 (+),score=283.96 TRINITY_DN215_c0_g3_i1:52-4374(+)